MCCRIELSGNCYVHGAIVTAGYKTGMCKAEKGGDLEFVDMYRYFRRIASDEEMTAYLIEGGGGNSFDHLETLTSYASQVRQKIIDKRLFKTKADARGLPTCELVSRLKKHGPGLVGRFVVENRFRDLKKDSPDPLLKPETITGQNGKADLTLRHAMVLVGVRMIDDEWYVLLQNWWQKMPFVEVSADYLSSSDARLAFILDDDVTMPEDFDRCNALYAEADLEGNDMWLEDDY
jgi:hypothetical protein